MQKSQTHEMVGPLFDNEGFANYHVIAYFLNQLFDKVYMSHFLSDKMRKKSKNIDRLNADLKSWIEVLNNWQYMKLDMNNSEEVKHFIEEKEKSLSELKSLLLEIDSSNAFQSLNPTTRFEEIEILFKNNIYATHMVNGFLKWGLISKGDTGLVINSLSLLCEPPNSKFISLQELFETYSASKTILFLDLKWEEQIQTRIHIEMSADSSSLQMKFADRCVLGREGALFRKTDLSSFLLSSYKTNLLSMKSPTCQFAERPSSTLLCEVEEGLYALWVEGLVFRSIVGNVTRGSSVLRTIIAKNTINDVFIEESGMILEQ